MQHPTANEAMSLQPLLDDLLKQHQQKHQQKTAGYFLIELSALIQCVMSYVQQLKSRGTSFSALYNHRDKAVRWAVTEISHEYGYLPETVLEVFDILSDHALHDQGGTIVSPTRVILPPFRNCVKCGFSLRIDSGKKLLLTVNGPTSVVLFTGLCEQSCTVSVHYVDCYKLRNSRKYM